MFSLQLCDLVVSVDEDVLRVRCSILQRQFKDIFTVDNALTKKIVSLHSTLLYNLSV